MVMRAVQYAHEAPSAVVDSPALPTPREAPKAEALSKDAARRLEVRRRISLAVDQVRAITARG